MPNLIDSVCAALHHHMEFSKGVEPGDITPYPGDKVSRASELIFLHLLLKESGFFENRESYFGFRYNESTVIENRKIIFSSVTAGTNGSGPATSVHQFYSVEEAKDLIRQLFIAIAQAEVQANTQTKGEPNALPE